MPTTLYATQKRFLRGQMGVESLRIKRLRKIVRSLFLEVLMSRPIAPSRSTRLGFLLLLVSGVLHANNPFRPVQTYDSGGLNSIAIAVGDVNGDGKPDILVGNDNGTSEGSVGVLIGNGDGTFESVKTYRTGGHSVNSIAVADVNADGRLDVLVLQAEGVAVLLGNGDGSFQAPISHPIDLRDLYGIGAIAVSDLNADGHPDLVVALPLGVGVLFGNGDGTFGPVQPYSLGPEVSSIVVADVNRDGKPDLVVYDGFEFSPFPESGSVAIFSGNGDGTFKEAQIFRAGGYDAGFGGSLAVADVNGDGNPDVITANNCFKPDCNVMALEGVLLGSGDGSFAAPKTHGTGGQVATAVAVADINRDGIPDLLVANLDGTVGLLFGNGDGTFRLTALGYSLGGPDGYSIAVADVNGDGTPDVFVASGCPVECGDHMISVLLSLFTTTTSVSSSLSPSVYGQAVTLKASVESNGPVAPTGTVVFMNGKAEIGTATLSGNVAALTKANFPAGTFSLTARYQGDQLSARSKSTPIGQTVAQAATVTAIESSLNPSMQAQLVKFTATVTSPTAKVVGTVTFTSGTTTLGTAVLGSAGRATFATSTLAHGQHKITAIYNGTKNILGSAASLTQTVN
jgi:hypothetical protein